MGKVKGKHRKDKYYWLAKECGYRSRASFKLVLLNYSFSFLNSAHAVLDLCAAPGGWMQVAVKHAPVGSLVLGVDLVPIAPIRGAIALQQDITKSECKSKVKRVMEEHRVMAFDVVLHDGSPNVGGAWPQELVCQNALVIDAVKLATQFLAPKGTFVTKVFRSRDYSSVLYCLQQLFEKVAVFKPDASRSASAEIYVLGLRYKAPAKIDPRLLDFKHLFQGSVEPQKKVIDVLRATKQKRHRDGYEDGETISKKMSTAADFIWSDSPLEILGSVTTITFEDPASLPIKDHSSTTEEVKALCDDLRVLGKQDFKHLLKWRMQLRKALSPSEKATPPTPTTPKDDDKGDEENEDDKLLNEMEELTYAMERKKKREKKLLAKRRAKDKSRKATGMQIDALEVGYIDHELFSLSSIKGNKDLAAVDSTEYDDGNVDLMGSEDEQIREESTEDESSSDIDSDEERRRYDEKIEEILDHAYEEYVSKKDGSTRQRKRAKEAYDKLEGGDGDVILSDHDSDMEEVDPEANPLMVPLDDGEGPTQEEITNRWFGQDIFADAIEQGDLGKYGSDDEMETNKQEERPAIPERSKVKKKQDEKTDIPNKVEEKKANIAAGPRRTKLQASKAEDDFEIVPAPATDSSDDSSSDDSDDDDVETKAEILACAKKMLRKKQRDQILDDACNKYMFHDDGLPKWFLDEEKRHCQPIKPVTKEEIAAMRAQFKEINARPAKKVAEAKARKKRIAMKKLDKVCQKANSISDQADISEQSKRKQIEQLYKKAMPKKSQKEYVVAKKGVQVRAGKGKVLVDRRMKKDARARGTGKPGKAGSKKGKDGKARKGVPSVKLDHAVTELTRSSSEESVAVAAVTTPISVVTPPLQLTDRPSCYSSASSSSEIETLTTPNINGEEESFVTKLKSSQASDIEGSLIELRKITRTQESSRAVVCTPRVLSAFRSLIVSRYVNIQVNSVAVLVNLSLEKINKVKIVRSGLVPDLIDVLKSGSPEAQEHACGALFSLALDDHNKTAIGVLGALQPLMHMLRSGNERTRHDSALALYHLSLVQSNRSKLVKNGSVQVLLAMVKSGHMTGRVFLILCNLTSGSDGRTAIHAGLRFKGLAKVAGAVEELAEVGRKTSGPTRDKARRMLEMLKRGSEEEQEEVDWEALLDSGLTNRTRFRPGGGKDGPCVNSSEF
ncbi:hypothetical protein HRI_001327000 [Hibiscus trionum]|uniref:Putative rRNA methyltransferase n=1 Tax=Hibiscus trionum TaxID=183268 RepID=A0A9W7HFP8_HIBTR|nr:hypothetical protein HRI_001327000 [Hibiscus trionum]